MSTNAMHLLISIPFVILLLSIAILPLATPHFWEKNRNKAIVATVTSLPVLIVLALHDPPAIFHTLKEYFSFICLLASLFIISGGISLTGNLKATPKVNVVFLAVGALLANLIGTTGASMVLIRPFLRTNSERKVIAHLPVFFIFIVANCAGLLTPLGDPPLFLGYLRGVPFFWTLNLFPFWLVMVGALLGIFYFWDCRSYKKEHKKDLAFDARSAKPLKINGWRNFLFLAGVLVAVFFSTPWRELMMIYMTIMSLVFGKKIARKENHFSYGPIIEVAIIFIGIFITMVPALMFLKQNGAEFGIVKPWQFFWVTGVLSSVLDNAPTYLTFFSLAQGLGLTPDVVQISTKVLEAISVGAVFMGANTYIGNGPNFMIKAISDHAGFKCPSFFGYMLYSVGVLGPLYILIHLVFFR